MSTAAARLRALAEEVPDESGNYTIITLSPRQALALADLIDAAEGLVRSGRTRVPAQRADQVVAALARVEALLP